MVSFGCDSVVVVVFGFGFAVVVVVFFTVVGIAVVLVVVVVSGSVSVIDLRNRSSIGILISGFSSVNVVPVATTVVSDCASTPHEISVSRLAHAISFVIDFIWIGLQ